VAGGSHRGGRPRSRGTRPTRCPAPTLPPARPLLPPPQRLPSSGLGSSDGGAGSPRAPIDLLPVSRRGRAAAVSTCRALLTSGWVALLAAAIVVIPIVSKDRMTTPEPLQHVRWVSGAQPFVAPLPPGPP
jgi:hypothetical protein